MPRYCLEDIGRRSRRCLKDQMFTFDMKGEPSSPGCSEGQEGAHNRTLQGLASWPSASCPIAAPATLAALSVPGAPDAVAGVAALATLAAPATSVPASVSKSNSEWAKACVADAAGAAIQSMVSRMPWLSRCSAQLIPIDRSTGCARLRRSENQRALAGQSRRRCASSGTCSPSFCQSAVTYPRQPSGRRSAMKLLRVLATRSPSINAAAASPRFAS